MLVEFVFALPSWLSQLRLKRTFWNLIAFANLGAVVAIWWTSSHYYIANPADGNLMIALGRLAGLIGELLILMQLVLIGRFAPVERLYGFDTLNRLHQWIGYSIIIFFLSHPTFLILGRAQQQGNGFVAQLAEMLAEEFWVFLAFLGLIVFSYVIALSVPAVRHKLRYETWYFSHWLMYLAIGLVFTHQIESGDMSRAPYLYYWLILNFVVFGVMLMMRFLRPLWLFARFRFRVAHIEQESPGVTSVYITGKDIGRFHFKAGQYANLTFLAKHLWLTHPFSISIEPNDATLRFSIKSLGDFTSKIPNLQPGTYVVIDGPWGRFTSEKARREKLLLIAGGIGVTPLRSMIGEFARSGRDIVLVYAARTPQDITFRKEIEGFQAVHAFPAHYIMSTPTEGYESGFLDKEKIVRLVPDFFDRDVFLCGPPPMMAACVKTLGELGVDKRHVHFEKFSF